MTPPPKEVSQLHTRLLKCALEVEESRAYWLHIGSAPDATAQRAFDEYWFGARSLARIQVLFANLRARFDAYPAALEVLGRWSHMSPDTRRVVCHWHLQLSDPLYRSFTGSFLVERRHSMRPSVTRDVVVNWVSTQGADRWTMATRIQFASKLLSSALSAGLLASNRDPRTVTLPRVPDDALEYMAYLLRQVRFEGTLLANPYFESVGLDGAHLEERLRALPGLSFTRQGDLVDYGWRYRDLAHWADANLVPALAAAAGGSS